MGRSVVELMRHWSKDLVLRFGTLKSAPRELWLVYVVNALDAYSYFALSYIYVIYASEEFGLSDSQAAWSYGIYGILVSTFGICIGFLVDNLGVRKSMIVGSICLFLSRTIIALTRSTFFMLGTLFTLMPFGTALGSPVITTAIRRYTTSANRAFGFSLLYVTMNVSALLAGLLVDAFRYAFGVADDEGAARAGTIPAFSGYRWLLLTAALANAAMAVIAAFVIREINVDEGGQTAEFTPHKGTPWAIMKQVATTGRFWRFILFILLLVGVRLIFRHMDMTFPKYMIRELGPGAPYGSITAINPFLIIFLVPLATAFIYVRTTPFQCILVGSFISAASPFFLVIGPYYPAAVAFVVVLSLGEAIWSPRLYEYTTMVAPEGREGTYAALAGAPLFAVKLAVGGMSGWLLDTFCPKEGPRNSRMMWFVIGATTASSPVLMFLFKGVIQKDLQRDSPHETEMAGMMPVPTSDEDEEGGALAARASRDMFRISEGDEGEAMSERLGLGRGSSGHGHGGASEGSGGGGSARGKRRGSAGGGGQASGGDGWGDFDLEEGEEEEEAAEGGSRGLAVDPAGGGGRRLATTPRAPSA